jgi:hypothetical protein
MSSIELRTPILEGGVQSINFFNGRLLSGEDLTQERLANRTLDWRLGHALGAGVAYGLKIIETQGKSTRDSPRLTVAAGLAINELGQTLTLPAAVELALVRSLDSPEPKGAAFAPCLPPLGDVVVSGTGVYVLLLSPASGGVGRAPVSGLGNSGTGCGAQGSCNSRYMVEGVQFRLVKLPLTASELGAKLVRRSLTALHCLGIGDARRNTFVADPFGPQSKQYGLLDDLREQGILTPSDVPLAAICWTAESGMEFIDHWSVRRRLTKPMDDSPWSEVLGDRRQSESEAIFRQFQDHIADLAATEPAPQTLTATDRFVYLPSAGVVPIVGTGSPRGFSSEGFFFQRSAPEIALLDGRMLRLLLRESLAHEPVFLDDGQKLQLYLIHDNVQAVEQGQSTQLSLVFASPTLPFRGTARFGAAHWAHSRFSSPLD